MICVSLTGGAWREGLSNLSFTHFCSSHIHIRAHVFGAAQLAHTSKIIFFGCDTLTCPLKNVQLYTVVVVNPKTGRDCPVAFLFSADNTIQPVADWLCSLKKEGSGLPNLRQVTIDCSIVEVAAILCVFPGLPIHWCSWHVPIHMHREDSSWRHEVLESEKSLVDGILAPTGHRFWHDSS